MRDSGNVGRDVVSGESVQCDATEELLAVELGERLGERMRTVEVGIAIGADDTDANAVQDRVPRQSRRQSDR